MGTFNHFSLKTCSRNCVQIWHFLGEQAIVFSVAMNNNTPVKLTMPIVETHLLVKLFRAAANYKIAMCISCQTFI